MAAVNDKSRRQVNGEVVGLLLFSGKNARINGAQALRPAG